MGNHFFLEKRLLKNQIARIEGEDAHHIINVMRLKINDQIFISFDDRTRGKAIISEKNKDSLIVKVDELLPLNEPSNPKVYLYISLLKNDDIDHAIRSLVELGVASVIPVIAERSVKVPKADKIEGRVRRWKKIAKSADMQSFSSSITPIGKVIKTSEIEPDADLNIVLSEVEQSVMLRTLIMSDRKIGSINLLIGPEGGLTDNEMKILESKNFIAARLGYKILRSKTAAIAAVGAISTFLFDIK